MLLNQFFHPIFQKQAVAHRDRAVGERHCHLQPPAQTPVMQQPQKLFGGLMFSRDTVGDDAKWRSNEAL
jgi:hypothetical protein